MSRFVMYWSIAGFLVPMAFLFITWIENTTGKILFRSDLATLVVWPSVVIYAAADAYADPKISTIILSLVIAIMLNVFLYSVVGYVLWRTWNLLRR